MPDSRIVIDPLHCIHTEDGHFGSSTLTKAADLDRMLDAYFAAPPSSGMVIHFHGGLVSLKAGAQIARNLTPRYEAAHAFPVFFLWESGALETVANNLGQISETPLFRELIRKVVEFVFGQMGGGTTDRGIVAGEVDAEQVATEVDAWFDQQTQTVPFDGFAPAVGLTERAAVMNTLDLELEIAANLEVDARVQAVLAGDVDATLLSPEAQDQVFEPTEPGEKGLLSSVKLAYTIARIVQRVVSRLIKKRGHGVFTTALEEVYRSLYVDKIGQAFLWDQMKQDTADAFKDDLTPGKEAGGTLFLRKLASRLEAGAPVPRIVLVGHSTGAIYICNFLKAADRLLPSGVKFDIVLLAPAVAFAPFADAMEKHSGRISLGRVRLFGMKDSVESEDAMAAGFLPQALARVVYPRSLLYFVSGLLEDSETDAPLLGMQRFWNDLATFGARYPGVEWARTHLEGATVWSVIDGGDGRRSASTSHGGFDDDPATLESLAEILTGGF